MKIQFQAALGALFLGVVACTCGPLGQITAIAEQAQEIAPTAQAAATLAGEVQEIAPTAAAAATLAGEFQEEAEGIEVDPDAAPSESGSDILPSICDTVSEDEVAAAFGTTVTGTGHSGVEEQATCVFRFDDGGAYLITIQDNEMEQNAAQNFAVLQTSFSANESVSHPGLTDAGWNEELGQLIAYKGQYLITSVGSSSQRDAVVAIAGAYGQNLP